MKPFRSLLLAGLLTAGVTALAGYAYAGEGGLKTLILQLPGGSVQQIQYAGPAPAQILVLPQTLPAALPVLQPDPFAQTDRISAIMNAQAAAMISAMNGMMAQGMPGIMPGPGALVPAALGPLPPGGSVSYSFVSTSSAMPGGACMESVEITTSGPGQAPKIVSRRAGACAGGSPFLARPAAAAVPQTQIPLPSPASAAPAPRLIPARAELPVPTPHPSQS